MTVQHTARRFFRTLSARAAVAAVALMAAAPAARAMQGDPVGPEPRAAQRVAITPADVALSNQKVRMAYDDLIAMWGERFAGIGERFAAPGLVRYRGGVRTACGVMGSDNAAYCPDDNRIYFDELFVAAQARAAAAKLGTDGDMAAVGVIAHEMGHAVAMQLGHVSRFPYQNEAVADCLAGAFANRANANGSLEKGDVDEAFYAMYSAGDPQPELTGNRRVDRSIMLNAALMGHGTYDKRMANFRAGLEGGAPACLSDFGPND